MNTLRTYRVLSSITVVVTASWLLLMVPFAEADEQADSFIQATRAVLESLHTLDASFCEIKSGTDVENFNLGFLQSATYQDVMDCIADEVRSPGNPIGNCSVYSIRYQQNLDKMALDIYHDSPSLSHRSKSYRLTSDAQIGYFLIPGDQLILMPVNKFYNHKCVFSDPGKLFSHFYLRNDAQGKIGIRRTYLGMIDRATVTCEVEAESVTLHSTFDHDQESNLIDAERGFCTMRMGSEDFLPRFIEYGYRNIDEYLWRVEVDKYFHQNGASYPERGRFSFLEDGKIRHICYYIVDAENAVLNGDPPSDDIFEIVPPPGITVFDRILGQTYQAQ